VHNWPSKLSQKLMDKNHLLLLPKPLHYHS
jgi:hypothetical protein